MTGSIPDQPHRRGVRPPKLSALIAEQIGPQIVHGILLPGRGLPSEAEMAASFHISRAMLRLGLVLLEAKGLIEIRHGRAATVRPPARWELADRDVLRWIRTSAKPFGAEYGGWEGVDLRQAAAQFANVMDLAAPELHANPVYRALARSLSSAGYTNDATAAAMAAPIPGEDPSA